MADSVEVFGIEILYPRILFPNSNDTGIAGIGRIDQARITPGTMIPMHLHIDGYERKSWEQMILRGKMTNPEKARTSLSWVKEMSLNDNCIEVIANHDRDLKPYAIWF